MSLNGEVYFQREMSLEAVILRSLEHDREIHSQRLQTVDEVRSRHLPWMRDTLQQLGYLRLSKADRGAVKAYLKSGLSRAQTTRLTPAVSGQPIRDH